MIKTGAILAVLAIALGLGPMVRTEGPRIEMVPVTVNGKILHVGTYEVSVAQWRDCVGDGACDDIMKQVLNPRLMPATGLNWFDTHDFVKWYNAKHDQAVRLPSAAEWAAINGPRPKTETKLLFDDPRLAWAATYGQMKSPGGPVRARGAWSEPRNGIHDLDGNVWEWTASCIDGADPAKCPAAHVVGAHDTLLSVFVREPASGGCSSGAPPTHVGFRLVED